MSKGTFARLPVELLKAVRANLHCLKDVVAFSQINKAAAKICDEAYWKKALIVAGFGRPTKPLIQLPKKWAALARIIVADSKRYARHDPRFGKDGYITEAVIFETAWTADDFEVLDSENPRFLRWHAALGTKDQFDPKATAFERKARIVGLEVYIDWSKKIEEVWHSPTHCFIRSDDEDSSGGAEEDWPGPLALLHPLIACRLICTPMASSVETGSSWHGDFHAVVKNKKGVTYGDVLHALAKQIVKVKDVSMMMGDHQAFGGFEYEDGLVPQLGFHFNS